MSATPGDAEFGAFTFGGDDDTDPGPSSMTIAVTQPGRMTVGVLAVAESSRMTISVQPT